MGTKSLLSTAHDAFLLENLVDLVVLKAPINCLAWRPDDASRSQSLPNLLKQYSFPLNPEFHVDSRGSVCCSKNIGPVPTASPICYEDFDFTDSSFLPCLCGFRHLTFLMACSCAR
ncbi:anti-virus transcriptional factor, partial [Olea europaea subsp. europaea]